MWRHFSRAAALLLVLGLPVASGSLNVQYDADWPIVAGVGEVRAEGQLSGGMLGAALVETRFGPTTLVVAERDGSGGFANATYEGATLVVHEGNVLSVFPDAARLEGSYGADFGILNTLPGGGDGDAETNASSADEDLGPAVMVAALEVSGALRVAGDAIDLFLFNATASVLDASGRPVAGFAARDVNRGLTSSALEDNSSATLVRVAAGAPIAWRSSLLAGAPADGELVVTLSPAAQPRFAETISHLATVGTSLSGAEGGGAEGLDSLEPLEGALNGGLVLLNAASGEEGGRLVPREATLDGEPLEPGLVVVLRGASTLTWSSGTLAVAAEPTILFAGQGFAASAPPLVGPFLPVVSLLLWLLAIGAIVWFFVRRPPTDRAPRRHRLAVFGGHVLVFLLAFWWWDRGFQQILGVGVLDTLAGGAGRVEWIVAAGLLAVELVAWVLAFLLFALPVRIAVGVILRQTTRHRGYKGAAGAAGLLALVVFGRPMVLWLLSVPLRIALEFAPIG